MDGLYILIAIDDRVQLVLSVDNMNARVSGRESLNGAAEPGRDLLETDVYDGTKSVRAKNRCHAGRLEAAGPTFTNFLQLFGPLRYCFPHLFGKCFGRFRVVEHHLRV